MKNKGNAVFNSVIVLLMIAFIAWVHRSCARVGNDMVYIEDNYSYDKETHIIYEESWNWFTQTLEFDPYYDDNGKMYKYDEVANEWIKLE